jgi:hypothetical protein
MTRFHGRIGYGESTEVSPGVFVDVIVEYFYYGDVVRTSRVLRPGANVNPDLLGGNSISIVGNEYALEHFFAIRYVEWAGELWTVIDVEIQRPRLILSLGEVYNGPTVAAPDTP